MAEAIRWHLELGDEVIARIADAHEYEFPWTYGVVVPSSEFERFRQYFTDSETWPEDDPAIEALCAEVNSRGGFRLRDLETGRAYESVTLNQNSEYVWFRFGNEVRRTAL
jgi:hypothetical protein